MQTQRLVWLFVAANAGCSHERRATSDGGADAASDVMQIDASACPRPAQMADRTRHLIVARPFDSSGQTSKKYEVLYAQVDSYLEQYSPPRFFEMNGRATKGEIVFTPDGRVGFIPFDDGQIGVFEIDSQGVVTPIDYAWPSTGFPSALQVSPDGQTLFIVDGRTRANGGGIYAATIHCDGTLTDRGLVAAGAPIGLEFRGGSAAKAVVAANDLLDHTGTSDELHLVDLSGTSTRVAGGDAFDGTNPVVTHFSLSANGNQAYVADADRIGITTVTDTAITYESIMGEFPSPVGVIASPVGDAAFIALKDPPDANEGINLFQLYKRNGAWIRWPVVFGGGLTNPHDIVSIDRGPNAGYFYIANDQGVGEYKFSTQYPGETVYRTQTLFHFKEGQLIVAGAIGITP